MMEFTNSRSKLCEFRLRLFRPMRSWSQNLQFKLTTHNSSLAGSWNICEVRSADGKPLWGSVMNILFMMEFTNSRSKLCEFPLRLSGPMRSWRQNLQFKLSTHNSSLAVGKPDVPCHIHSYSFFNEKARHFWIRYLLHVQAIVRQPQPTTIIPWTSVSISAWCLASKACLHLVNIVKGTSMKSSKSIRKVSKWYKIDSFMCSKAPQTVI